jgi:hypothetical protein
MKSKEPKLIDDMLSLLTGPKRKALKEVFHKKVIVAYTQFLNNELAAVLPPSPKNSITFIPQSKGASAYHDID